MMPAYVVLARKKTLMGTGCSSVDEAIKQNKVTFDDWSENLFWAREIAPPVTTMYLAENEYNRVVQLLSLLKVASPISTMDLIGRSRVLRNTLDKLVDSGLATYSRATIGTFYSATEKGLEWLRRESIPISEVESYE